MSSRNWIRFEGRTYIVGPGERALDAMLRQGAPVAFSCRKGSCRSCMMQAKSGHPGAAAIEPLPQEYRDLGMFLPCCATDVDSVEAVRPDLSLCIEEAVVAAAHRVTPDILRLQLEPMRDLSWRPGQVIGLMNPDGAVRSYSVISSPADYYLDLTLRIYPQGAVSGWAASLNPGDTLRFQAPSGSFVYREELKDLPLLLVGTGTGGGVLSGIVRDAVAKGHRGPIRIYHGGRTAADLYLGPLLADLPEGRVTFVQAASRQATAGHPPVRITDLAFADAGDLSRTAIFLCGNGDMVETARIAAMRAGASLDLIFTDPFDPPEPYRTTETQKLRSIQPDPELWEALGKGDRLTAILTEFYTRLYDDPRLAPFFHRTTKQRAIEKQFNFLQDLFSGTKLFFGEKPFNAHHWMVISDDLFDHREKLFFSVVREFGLAEPLIHRWAALHEMFRREIVKAVPRGLLRDGVEQSIEGYAHEIIDVGSVCDGCFGEIGAGTSVLMHNRTGEVFCRDCEGRNRIHAA